MREMESQFRVQIEIFQKNSSIMIKGALKSAAKRFLKVNNFLVISEQKHMGPDAYQEDELLRDHVEFLEIIPSRSDRLIRFQDVADDKVSIFVTKLNDEGYQTDEISATDDEQGVQGSRELYCHLESFMEFGKI